MRIVERDVYVGEFSGMTLTQKLFHVAANYYMPDWDSLAPNANPLYWCIMDLFKLVKIFVLFVVIYPFIVPLLVTYEALTLVKRYNGDKFKGVHLSGAYYLELSK